MIECALLSLYLSAAEQNDCDREVPQPLTIEYYERPPYAWTGADGKAHGMAVDPVRAALDKAGLAFRFVAVPSSRELVDIARADHPVCAVGRYKTPQREQQAKFSGMLMEERPYAAFTRADLPLGGETDLADLLGKPALRIVVKLQRSYGARIDEALASARSALMPISGNAFNAVRMVQSRRADVALLTLDEVDFVTEALGMAPSSYSIARLSGFDRGEKNYLMCSKASDDSMLRYIDAKLAAQTPH